MRSSLFARTDHTIFHNSTFEKTLDAILPDNQVAPDSLMQLRDFAMIYLMLKTGLRAVEVSRAKVGDIKPSKGDKVLFVHGKGDKEKIYG